MAQLHVQKKRAHLGWLWIVIFLIIIAVAYYMLVRNNVLPDTFGLNTYTSSLIDVYKNNNTV